MQACISDCDTLDMIKSQQQTRQTYLHVILEENQRLVSF